MTKPALPEFDEDDRNLIVLAVRAGLDRDTALRATRVEADTLTAWLAAGKADTDAGRQSDAAAFAQLFTANEQDAAKTHVLAANVVRDAVRSDPASALKHLKELQAQHDYERARELTAGT